MHAPHAAGVISLHAAPSNDQGVCPPLRRVCDRTQSMLAAGAYVHHFARHGVDAEWFRDALAVGEQTVLDYEAL